MLRVSWLLSALSCLSMPRKELESAKEESATPTSQRSTVGLLDRAARYSTGNLADILPPDLGQYLA